MASGRVPKMLNTFLVMLPCHCCVSFRGRKTAPAYFIDHLAGPALEVFSDALKQSAPLWERWFHRDALLAVDVSR